MSKADNGRLYYATGIDNSQLRADAEQSKNILQSIGKTASQEGGVIDKTFNNIGKSIAAVFTVQQATAFARKVVEVRGEIESLEKSFEILAGKTKGKKLFADIKDFAVTTPMAMGELAKGAQTLLSFNVAADEVMPIMRAIGDIAMGDAQKFNSLTLAFAQMQSTGKLMGQDLLQMINAGFNPLSIIAEKTGKSIGELKEEMSSGAISADMIKQAFMDATAEGGKFHGMLEAQSQGIKGSISNLEGAIEDMFNSIGEKSQGLITGSIQTVTQIVQNYEKVGRILKDVIVIYGTYKAALIAATAVQKFVIAMNAGWTASELLKYKALLLVEKAQKLLNATMLKNPYVLAAAAITGLVFALYKAAQTEDAATAASEAHAEAIETLNKKYDDEKNLHNSVIELLNDETASRILQIEALEGLEAPYQRIIAKYQDEKGHIADVIALQKELSREREKQKLKESENLLTKYNNVLNHVQNGDYNSAAQIEPEAFSNVDRALFESDKSYQSRIVEYWKTMVENQSDEYTKALDRFNAGELMELTDEQLQKKKADIENEIERYIAEAKKLGYNEDSEGVKDNINSIKTFGGYDGIIQEMERRNAGNPNIIKNKAYWEQYIKEQQALLDAMTGEQLLSEKASEIKSNILSAQEQLSAYNVKNGAKEDNTTAIQTADRNEKIREYGETVAREVRQAELDIEQARIDGMEDGLEKELAQNELNYNRLIEENKRRQEEMVEALRDVKQLEWENVYPDFKEKGLTFDRSSITEKDLSLEQTKQLSEYERIANEQRVNANKKSLDNILSDILTYEQERTRITEEYERKRNSLYTTDTQGNKILREGVTQGNVDELNTQEQDALSAIDEQFAQREISYQVWCDEIANFTLSQLIDILEQARNELENIEDTNSSDNKVSVARAKVATLTEIIEKKKAQNDVSPNKRSIKEWEDLYSTLQDVNREFESIGDTVGGLAGDIISTAGSIMSSTLSMINGIVQLVNMSSKGMQGTAAAAATAISTVEKASVILTVISAAIQIAMQIVNLLNSDDDRQEEIQALQGRIDQLQWELDNADAILIQENSFKAMDMLSQATAEARIELYNLCVEAGDVQGAFFSLYSNTVSHNALLEKSVKKIADAYANIQYTADKALGEAKYDSARKQLENLAEQQLLLQQQMATEQNMKDPDEEAIAEYERKIQEIGADMATLINDMVDDIMGGSVGDIAQELGDAFFEAFSSGEDYAEAWGDKVKDIVGDITKRMLITKFLEEPLGQIFDKYKKIWFPDGEFAGADAVIASMGGLNEELLALGEDFGVIWEELPEDIKNMFTGEFEREASEKGIATASQESVDELNGRMTAVQGHTYSINENMKMLTEISSAVLESVLNIESYAERIAARMDKMENSLNDVRLSVEDMYIKGIKFQ